MVRDPMSEAGGQSLEILSGVTNPFNKSRFQENFLGISAGIILVVLSWQSFFQLNTWKNGITLFEHAVSVTQNNYRAENNLGTAYSSKDLDKALFRYKAALKIKPAYAMALYNLGIIYEKKGQTDGAISNYLKALQINPDYFDALNNIGMAFYNQGDYDRAFYILKAVRIDPNYSEAHKNLEILRRYSSTVEH